MIHVTRIRGTLLEAMSAGGFKVYCCLYYFPKPIIENGVRKGSVPLIKY